MKNEARFGLAFLAAVALSRGVAGVRPALAETELSGSWHVTGKDLDCTVSLPGTLADARLGRRYTAEDWRGFADQRLTMEKDAGV